MSTPSAARSRPDAVQAVARPIWEEDLGWQRRAACRGADANLFFIPNQLETKDEREARESAAKAVCAECPVRDQCLDYALGTREPHGIWGGLNEIERRHVLERRRAG